ncbi:MAG: carbohydrate binding family 9 domain-containing protein [Crocinitomicaceae bacterium]|nr:carbohydrate binding family 9 domain-containing protein [Flavobacteriales bacterium]NQZ38141.1 carbohydrate binding family 9 domain-containing protein [Crocinitomicaceae bacterium]
MTKTQLIYCSILSLVVLVSTTSWSQTRTYIIDRDAHEIKIDGELTEPQWSKAEIATDFIDAYPKAGIPSKYQSIVRMYYDDNALYIGGEMHDSQPDSVSYTLSQRDDWGNADWFGIMLDPYANNINSFMFSVTAAGVEFDALLFTDDADVSWNAVWRSSVKKQEYGWSFEMKIPFSAVRFPNKAVQEWNINLVRQVRRDRQKSYWNEVNPEVFGEITQTGKLVGMKDIKSPIRLSFTPYVTGYAENSYDYATQQQTWGQRVTGGLDVKYGLNDAFTLDMTLIPDFGQTTSDKQVLNLGPFEVRFDENRPFFLEGTDLFSIGNVFYSRRIGAETYNYRNAENSVNDSLSEEVTGNPNLASLINGTKVSGRTSSGLGIGVFNSVENRAFATISDPSGNTRKVQTHPLTNYNVFVLSQSLQNNSSISFVNTNVMREGGSRDANVSVGQTNLFSRDKKFLLNAELKVSSIFEGEVPELGHALGVNFEKVSGIWRYGFGYGEESDTYDPNDLGFLYNNNSRSYYGELRWNDYSPGKYFLRKWAQVEVYYEELYKPKLFSYGGVAFNMVGTFKNFLTVGLNGGANPFGEVNHFESRHFGKEVRFGPNVELGGFYSSDYSKRFALDLRFWYKQFVNSSQKGTNFALSPRVRLFDRLFVVFRTKWDFITADYGYVRPLDDTYSDDIILGFRDRLITENSLQTEFIFTKRMGIDIRIRHYWQQVEYYNFNELRVGGELIESNYNPVGADGSSEHNTNYNAFTVDVNYRWVFIPGSELRLVYKNNIFDSKNSLIPSYFRTFDDLFDQPQLNSVSMKLLVYVDAIYFKRKGNKL